jgi:hypothetical protein
MILSREKMDANFVAVFSEVFLGESKNKYPTIPAIEVTIPHFQASLNVL